MNSEEKRQLKQNYRQTKEGKKAFITYVVLVVVFIITLISYYILMNVVDEDYYDTVRWTAAIIFGITCYYEGCYVGALKQYIIDHTKKK